MSGWKRRLLADPIRWLLESDDPALRHRVLVDILDRPPDDAEVQAARAAIPQSPVVAAILAAQQPEGHWAEAKSTYFPKYKATHWQMILLADFGLDGSHPAVQRGLQRMAGAIAAIGAADAIAQGEVLWCYTGNTLRFLSGFGLGTGEGAARAAERMIELGRSDSQWTCRHSHGKTCLWGAVKALRGLSAMPPSARPPGATEVMASAAQHLLACDYAGASEGAGVTENGWESDWLRFGFPSFYESDLLEALEALSQAGYGHERGYHRLLEAVSEKQDRRGRWRLENSFNGRMHADVETKGEPSRWLTLRALRVLRAAEEHQGLFAN